MRIKEAQQGDAEEEMVDVDVEPVDGKDLQKGRAEEFSD